MKVILDCENANISYDRSSNSIIAILHQSEGDQVIEKLFQKIEYAFSRYNAKYLISNCCITDQPSKDSITKFFRNLIKIGIQKIAIIGEENLSDYHLGELESFSLCKAKCFPCVTTAQEWVIEKN